MSQWKKKHAEKQQRKLLRHSRTGSVSVLLCLFLLCAAVCLQGLHGAAGEESYNRTEAQRNAAEKQQTAAGKLQDAGPGDLYAQEAVLLDGDSGRVLFGKEESRRVPMASTTKIMTCIIALERGNLQQICTFSGKAASAPKVKLGAPAGRTFYLEDLLYSMMLESHNDSAVAVAEAIAGSTDGFAALMNEKAKQLGLTQTSFVTPNGLDADGHETTAWELALIMRYCAFESPKREEFLRICQRQSYTFEDTEHRQTYTAVNHNAFLNRMDGVLCGKTGFTGKAGYCYVCALERDGKKLVVALLACGWPGNRSYKWADTEKLLRYGLGQYEIRLCSADWKLPQTLPVANGQYAWRKDETGASVVLQTDAPEQVRYLMRSDEALECRLIIPKSIDAPVKTAQQLGSIEYRIGQERMEIWPVTAATAVQAITPGWYLSEAGGLFLLP